MPKISQQFLAVGLILALLTTGCGRSKVPVRVAVRGAILFENQPLKLGRITFLPVEGTTGPAAVATVSDGFYDFNPRTGPIAGKNKVKIEATVNPGFSLDDESAYSRAVQQHSGHPILPPQPVPPEYNERSRLRVDVSPGGDTKFDFRIETPKAP